MTGTGTTSAADWLARCAARGARNRDTRSVVTSADLRVREVPLPNRTDTPVAITPFAVSADLTGLG